MRNFLKSLLLVFSKSKEQFSTLEKEKKELDKILFTSIHDALFVEFAHKFFSNKWHFCRPIAIDEIVLSCLKHKQVEVTSVSLKKNREDVMNKLKLYCQLKGISMNPQIVYRSDIGSKYPRYRAWVTPFLNDCPTNQPREIKHTRCCFFYKTGDEPQTIDNVLPCPERDEEWLEEMQREEKENE